MLFGAYAPPQAGELSAKLTEGVFADGVAPSVRFAATSPAVAGEDKRAS
ncbi:MAG: hypothetical protein RL186_997, partial [Pseudomonadota bacterium]